MTRSWPALAAAALLALSACTEGYDNQSDPLFLNYGMSQDATLAAMDQLGESKNVDHRTHFRLMDGCVLKTYTPRHFWEKDPAMMALRGTETTLQPSADGNTYSVQLTRPDRPGEQHATLLEGASWTEATQMKWLLDCVQGFC